MKQKLTALALSTTLCLGLFTGCQSGPAEVDPDKAYAGHQPTDVVMTVNGSEVTWSEFFNRLYNVVYQIQYYSEDGKVDWDAPCTADETLTNGEFAWQTAVDTCLQYHVLSTHAEDLEIQLNEEDEAAMAAQLAVDMQNLAGEGATEEQFNTALSQVYLTREVYDFSNRVVRLYDRAFETVCGLRGEKLSQEDIDACIADNQYITAKHILISTQDYDGSQVEGQALAEKTALATLLHSQLQEVQGDREKLETKFDEMMTQYSDDTGLPYYPNGYTFKPGEMVEEFDTAARALGEYELSEVISTDYGYHIILRLPTTAQSEVTYVDETLSYTIGDFAAASTFERLLSAWIDEAEVIWSADFEKLTAEKVFK